jgi:hypothetical protein
MQAARASAGGANAAGKDLNAPYWQYVEFTGPNTYSIIMSRKDLLEQAMMYCGCSYTLNVSGQGDENSEVSMAVEGLKDCVQDAVGLIYKLLADIVVIPNSSPASAFRRFNKDNFNPQTLTLEATSCPADKTWLLFQNRGAAIKNIMRKSGTSITVLKNRQAVAAAAAVDGKNPSSSGSMRNVIVIGSIAEVQSAKALLALFIEDAGSDVNMKRWGDRQGVDEEVDFDEEGELDDDDDDEDDSEGGADGEDELDQAHASIECPDDKVGLVIGFNDIKRDVSTYPENKTSPK